MKPLIYLLTATLSIASAYAESFDLPMVGAAAIKAQWGDFDAPQATEIPFALNKMSWSDADFDASGPKAVHNVGFQGYTSRGGTPLSGSTQEWARNQGTPIQGCMTPSQRMAACGPIAAEALVRFFTKNPNLDMICEIWNIAKSKGYWSGAMQGPDWSGQRGLLRDLDIEVDLVWVSNLGVGERMVRESLDRGKPVIISTKRHYFFASGYGSNGQLFVGYTGQIMSQYGGSARMTLTQISQAGNGSLALLIPR